MNLQLDREELAWAAGFVDGEGHFKCCGSLALEVAQIDRRVLDRLHKALGGLGKVYGPYGPYKGTCGKSHSRSWKYISKGFEQGQAVIALLWTWLGPIKREQARAALAKATKGQFRRRKAA